MQISFNTLQNNNNNYYGTSFKAMCKTDFMFFDRKVIEKVKAPIKDFNVYRDFDKYCKGLVDNIMKTDFGGSNPKIAIQRKNILDSWFKYIKRKPTYDLRIPEKLMILLGITENLKPNNNSMPPFLNKGVWGTHRRKTQQLRSGVAPAVAAMLSPILNKGYGGYTHRTHQDSPGCHPM